MIRLLLYLQNLIELRISCTTQGSGVPPHTRTDWRRCSVSNGMQRPIEHDERPLAPSHALILRLSRLPEYRPARVPRTAKHTCGSL
jgi:hypothetical protein